MQKSAPAQRRKAPQAEDLLKILVPVAVIILLLIIISRLRPDRNDPGAQTAPAQTEESISGEYIPEEESSKSDAGFETDETDGETEESSSPEETSEAETSAPETGETPETSAPETTAPPETSAPETTAPPETSAPETTAPPETSAPETTAPPETSAPETAAPPETSAPAVTYITTTELYVRSEPSGSSRSLGVLGSHVPVEFVRAYDDTWAVIMFEGQEAYVSFRYLTPQ